jgi:hypothetical protein
MTETKIEGEKEGVGEQRAIEEALKAGAVKDEHYRGCF